MSRRGSGAAEAAAAQASEAARVLQARQQEARQAAKEQPKEEPQPQERPQRRDDGEAQPIGRGNAVREQMMEEIRASRGEPRVGPEETPAEPKAEPKPEPKPEPQAAAEPEQPKEEPKAEPAAAAPQTVTPAPDAPAEPKTVRVKVDGEEMDVPEEEVEAAGGVKAYQMLRAADNRLKKANEALAETRRMQAEALTKQAPAKPSETDAQFIASKLDEIRFGTPEQGAAAWQAIQERTAPKADAMMHQTMAHLKFDMAEAQFAKENADLIGNPMVAKLVGAMKAEEVGKLVQDGQPNWQAMAAVDWTKTFSTIAQQVRSAFGRQSQLATAPAKTASNPSQPSEKEARKASITNLPSAAARAELPKEERPETREEALNRMRKDRGLPLH